MTDVAGDLGPSDLGLRRALAGAALAQGAPLGWLALRWLVAGAPPGGEVASAPWLYAYLFVATTVVFTLFGYVLGSHEEALAEANARIARLTRTDPLTRLENARALAEALPRLVSFAQRSGGALSVVALDVDRFKGVNDVHGRAEGDELLRRVAIAIGEGRREEDVVARPGGDEFVLVLPGIEAPGAIRAAERALEAVRRLRFKTGEAAIAVQVSAGVATLEHGEDARSLLARADAALSEAKRAGRDRSSVAPARAAT